MFKTLKKILWTVPFICFISGYLILDIFYHPQDIETPALVGKTIDQAFTILSHHNLNARLLTFKEDAIMQEGTIISQIPAACHKIKQNQSVFLVISTLPKKTKTPNMLFQTHDSITETLKKNKINVKSFKIHSTYPDNQCFAQIPSPGQPLESDTMTLYISAGMPKVVLMPSFKNKPLEQVLEFLQSYPVNADVVHAKPIDDNHSCSQCVIINQSPLPGSIITLHPTKSLHIQLLV